MTVSLCVCKVLVIRRVDTDFRLRESREKVLLQYPTRMSRRRLYLVMDLRDRVNSTFRLEVRFENVLWHRFDGCIFERIDNIFVPNAYRNVYGTIRHLQVSVAQVETHLRLHLNRGLVENELSTRACSPPPARRLANEHVPLVGSTITSVYLRRAGQSTALTCLSR